ncbi:LysR family transcriptional regulator [Pseudomonas sp. Y39-6]|uniref:LysR family transcriptional regulator n=1 Tax=Pseudomonas sp. Y39-6 TaxID=2749807 RepID=UPI001910C107|nr:LysR family transcriptional regulator [Pseudomonas sp. Y39-6]QPO21740.1 LysR family transcriptional regulator [Pseudomonas sp. Y39-6]URS58998.1 LysR family transcriptional regulator [Pseudomonas sp. Y39-6]
MELSDIDLNLLVSLEVLLQECNVTHAAQRLNISQPALSAQLARLRLAFNDPLLMPAERGRGMTPTAMGLLLEEPLSTALKGLKQLVRFQPSFNPQLDSRLFNIAASDNAMIALGTPLLTKLQTFSPQTLRFIFGQPQKDQIATQFERGEIDLLIDDVRLIPQNMKSRTLFRSGFVMAQRQGHPRGTAPLDLEAYCSLQHLLVSSDTGNPQGYMDEYLSTLQRSRNVVVTLPQLSLVPKTLQSGNLVCTLPASLLVHFVDGLDLFELPFTVPEYVLSVAWHPRNHYDPGVTWLRELILEIASV